MRATRTSGDVSRSSKYPVTLEHNSVHQRTERSIAREQFLLLQQLRLWSRFSEF